MLIALVGTAVLYAVGWLLSGRRRDGLVPAAILGGVIGLVLRQFDLLPGSVESWQQVGYHLFGISFLAIGLTRSEHDQPVTGGAVWVGVGQGMTFAVQATVGGLVTMALIAAGRDVFPAFGFLAPMGLEEGPGQAVSIGALWESAGFADAPSLGATIASIGFVAAYGLGLVALRLRQRGERTNAVPQVSSLDVVGEDVVGESDTGGRREDDTNTATTAAGRAGTTSTAISEDHDVVAGAGRAPTPAWRSVAGPAMAVVAGYTALFWAVRWGAGLVGEDVRDTVLGVLFFIALLVGIGVRALLARFHVAVAPRPQQAITLAAVDGLTVAILASLAWARIASAALPLALVVVTTIIATVAAVAFATRQLTSHRFDRALALFGTVTGTVSSGLALLSLSDPDQSTPVAVELGSSVVVSAPMVIAGVAIATAAAQGGVALAVATGIFAVIAMVAAAVLVWAGRHFDAL